MSYSKPHLLQLIKQLQDIAENENPKLAPQDSFFMLSTVKYLGLEIGFKTIETIQCKIAAVHKVFSPNTKIELMRFIGSRSFYSKFIDELHVDIKPLYD